jgi:hypothetical protein
MMASTRPKKAALPILMVLTFLVSGCGIAASYRTADQKTIRDFSAGSGYRKQVGVLSLDNTTIFTDAQAASPFMTAFLSALASTAPDAALVEPGQTDAPLFLSQPPRIPDGRIDLFRLARMARERDINTVVRPVLMNIHVRKRHTGFWFFRSVSYSLQIQAAATLFDTTTGSRLALKILTDEVPIDRDQANMIDNGKEIQVDELADVARKMGGDLGEYMGDAVRSSRWMTSVDAIDNGTCVISAGEEEGLQPGDRFAVLDGSATLKGPDGQRYIVPGVKIGEVTIRRVLPRKSFATAESGHLPPAGSILIPGT